MANATKTVYAKKPNDYHKICYIKENSCSNCSVEAYMYVLKDYKSHFLLISEKKKILPQ